MGEFVRELMILPLFFVAIIIIQIVHKKKRTGIPNARFWNKPDHWLVSIIINENEKVWGRVKGNMGLLTNIPLPDTGYFYHDVVYVEGPIGKTLFRDEEVLVYKAIRLYKSSNIPTFRFKFIKPLQGTLFPYQYSYTNSKICVRMPHSSIENNFEWRTGYLTASNGKEARKILDEAIASGAIEIKDIERIK